MLKWLKNKATGVSNAAAAERLRAEFKHLENVPNVPDRVAERLADYVLTGDNPDALRELARLQNAHLSFSYSALLSDEETEKGGLPKLVNCIPQDPEILLRLARVYEAIRQAGAGSAAFVFGAPVIPSLPKSLSWLSTFLLELSSSGQQKEPIFPAGLVVAMIETSGENPNALLRAPFFCEDAQGKSQLTRWTMEPFTCFYCLDQFPELVLSSPDEIRPAFRQKQAGSRASVLHALSALRISPVPFTEEIAALAVSGSKEVREYAAPLISEQFPLFKKSLEHHAEKGSADERFQAVRLLARLGGDAEREFLAQRLTSEKSEKICEILREALEPTTSAQATPGAEDYNLPEIPEVPVHAPLDKKLLPTLRDHLHCLESNAALLFADNLFAQQQGWTRTPVPLEAADRLFDALQTFVTKDPDLRKYFKDCMGVEVTLPEIELSGIGAHTWQSGSGYIGLTVIFWANESREFLTWSYARPEIQRVDARQRFYGEGPWEGAQSPKQVSISILKLRRARRTVNGRLSGSTKTSALVLSPVKPGTLDFGERLFTQWHELERYVASKRPLGLRDPNPLDLLAVLQPHQFGERRFDSILKLSAGKSMMNLAVSSR